MAGEEQLVDLNVNLMGETLKVEGLLVRLRIIYEGLFWRIRRMKRSIQGSLVVHMKGLHALASLM